VLVFGWEPGGGVDARCQEMSTDLERSLFVFDGETGDEVGRFVFERFRVPTRTAPSTTTTWCRCATELRPGPRQLSVGNRCHRLHRPLQPQRDRVERPATTAARAGDRDSSRCVHPEPVLRRRRLRDRRCMELRNSRFRSSAGTWTWRPVGWGDRPTPRSGSPRFVEYTPDCAERPARSAQPPAPSSRRHH
jgi:hypothetical protein